MYNEFKYEAGVSLECRSCRSWTTIPALKVLPGVNCSHCGAMLNVDTNALAAKTVMLAFAAGRNDTKVD